MSTISQSDMTQLQALADNELPAAQANALRNRMTSEPALADAFSELAMMRTVMESMPAVRPPRSMRLDRQTMQQARGWRWWLISPPGGQFMPAMGMVACLCMVLLFGTGYGQENSADVIHLKGSVEAPLMADAAGTAEQSAAPIQKVTVIDPQSEPSLLPLWGVTAGVVGTLGSARWLMRLRKIQRRVS